MTTRSFTTDEQLARAPSAPTDRADKDYTRGPYGQPDFICSVCDARPCCDNCPAQTNPDTLERKAARAGLTPLAWLQRDQERSRAPFPERFPDHPAATEARTLLRAAAAGLSAAPAAPED